MVDNKGNDSLDSLGLWPAMLTMADQIDKSLGEFGDIANLPANDSFDHILILGTGDSGLSGDLVAACSRPFANCPIVVYNDFLPPSWIGPRTLVIALSFSGATEETIESLDASISKGAKLIAVTDGGELEKLALRNHAPVLSPMKFSDIGRANSAALAVPAMLALEQLGNLDNARRWLTSSVPIIHERSQNLVSDKSQAKGLASLIEGSTPVIYGDGTIGTAAAKRWKAAFNHNYKSPAFWAPMPELVQNDMMGWNQSDAALSFTQVQLRHSGEHAKTSERFSYVLDQTSNSMSEAVTVVANGDNPIAQLFDLVMLGDFVSLELAFSAKVDPGPTPEVDNLKQWLI